MTDSVVLQSAVRVPTPPPGTSYSPQPSASRKRSPPSRSPSPRRRRSPPGDSLKEDGDAPRIDPERAVERERQLAERLRQHERQEAARKPMTEEEKQAAAKAEYEKLLNMRSGGTYIPPARLRALQAQITDKTSKEYQRMAWEALKKSINGLINKVNVSNIKFIVPELFGENLVRGRGLFCRSIMKAQAASLPFTPIYAAMAAIVNTKLPQVGELLLSRLIVQFRKAFKRNDKAVCISSTTFIAHLCNQQVAHEMLAAQILLLLLHKPTDDSVEIAVGLTREVGQHLEEMSGPIALAVFDQFRNILHEADIDKRVQYMIEVLFQVRKDRYKDNPAIKEELDLVEEEDQITHRIGLDDEIDTQDGLNVFKFDPQWEEHEEAYKKLKAEILGEGSDDEEDEDETDESSDEEEEQERQMEIKDQSNTDLVNLRRTIYLTIMSSIDFEECCHKLMKISLPPGLEPELPSMIIECCSQERTYSKFYGLIGERFAKINRLWSDLFEASFAKYYDTIHRYETNRLRNIARFFGHMLSTDAIGWHVLSIIHLNEDETTSSSRIFIKILFQDLGEHLGLPKLQQRMRDEILRPSFEGLFPLDNPRNTRFSINYFTSIGFGILTEDMREHLKNLPKPTVLLGPARDHIPIHDPLHEAPAGVVPSVVEGRTRYQCLDLLEEEVIPRATVLDRDLQFQSLVSAQCPIAVHARRLAEEGRQSLAHHLDVFVTNPMTLAPLRDPSRHQEGEALTAGETDLTPGHRRALLPHHPELGKQGPVVDATPRSLFLLLVDVPRKVYRLNVPLLVAVPVAIPCHDRPVLLRGTDMIRDAGGTQAPSRHLAHPQLATPTGADLFRGLRPVGAAPPTICNKRKAHIESCPSVLGHVQQLSRYLMI
ncbi:pre-mRNA-splicing factor cwc22 [Aspergillus thermomutatus]|uniref:Pre-mRNA-splicing factor CWC22 n=1 Tax=Aspergillus thermomutatus TaxID=41047 RepID=A0A397HT07_ASPTH|nr:pre-mRNA-splicing factor cwc22 [Aspergillus thermomutatus]RHZ66325.1 pre-mRNA-splicing factor cwc22 [Aspergillus thermomutatus]